MQSPLPTAGKSLSFWLGLCRSQECARLLCRPRLLVMHFLWLRGSVWLQEEISGRLLILETSEKNLEVSTLINLCCLRTCLRNRCLSYGHSLFGACLSARPYTSCFMSLLYR